MDLLVCISTKKSTLTSYQAWNWFTIMHTWYHVSMNKFFKRNSNTLLILEFLIKAVPLSVTFLALLLQNRMPLSDNFLTSALSTNVSNKNNTCCLLSMISSNGFQDTSISQNLISQCNTIPLNSIKNPNSCV